MTVQARELSQYDSEPLELYRFVRGSDRWLFNSGTDLWTGSDGTYLPAVISRNAPSQSAGSADTAHSTLELTVPRDFPIVSLFQGGPPAGAIWLTLLSAQQGLLDTEVQWQGKVRQIQTSGSTTKVLADPLDKALSRSTLRQTYGAQCPLDLYGTRCGLKVDDWTVDGTVASINGLIVGVTAASSKADGWWLRGELYCPRLSARRTITTHAGSSLTLDRQIPGLAVGDALKLVRGCNHLWKDTNGNAGDCSAVFHNTLNFAGWPYVPGRNVFTQGV